MILKLIIAGLCTLLLLIKVEAQENSNLLGNNAPEGFLVHDTDNYYPQRKWSDVLDWQLLKAFSTQKNNILISPISLKIILALLHEGSAGNTQSELQSVLQASDKKQIREGYRKLLETLKPPGRKEFVLNLGTRIFLDSDLKLQQQFQTRAQHYFETDIEPTNFTEAVNASQSINSWIDKITNGRVRQLVHPDDLKDAIMLITNAVYFKGTWRHQFPKNQTFFGGFYKTPNEVITVPYMSTTSNFYYHESPQLDAKILRLPYKGNRYSMFLVLPNSKGGLKNLIKRLSLDELHRQLYGLSNLSVNVYIPKFKFNFQARFNSILKKLGLNQMFQNTSSFPGMVAGKNSILRRLVVSDIIQKSGIDVDEEGSVVYSATELIFANKFGEANLEFNASQPFLFFIEEKESGSILFVGKVENPLEVNSVYLPPKNEEENTNEKVNKNGIADRIASEDKLDAATTVKSTSALPPTPLAAAPPLLSPPPQLAPAQNTQNTQPYITDRESIIRRFNFIDLELFKEFSELNENVFISPASIKTTLAMILEGARGESYAEIAQALRIPNLKDENVRQILSKLLFDLNDQSGSSKLEAANALFVSNKLRVYPEYKAKLQKDYKGTEKSLDFSDAKGAASAINSWVSNATHGAIDEIIAPQNIMADTSMIISNALYFKAKWKTMFEASNTRPKCFRNIKNQCFNMPMMVVADVFNYNFNTVLNSHVFELPYQDKYSMLVILPNEVDGLRLLTRDLQHFVFHEILAELKQTEIILDFPKFSIDFSVDLVQYLKPLRIREIFEDKANLTGIVNATNVKVNNLIHKARIDVDEVGTVAAAATGAIVIPLMESSTLRLVVDHPFAFFIYNRETQNIIFEGVYASPVGTAPQAPVRPAQAARSNFYPNNIHEKKHFYRA